MDTLSLIGIAVGLSMDAFAVSVTNGAVQKKVTLKLALRMAGFFGFFQALMPLLGWLVGKAGEGFISSIDHWVALILLGFIGIQMIVESRKKEEDTPPDDLNFKRLTALAVATSIDALATGVILPTAVGAYTPALMAVSVCLIGAITFVLCLAGVWIGKKFGGLLADRAELLGGIVLVLIGIKIFADHIFLAG